MRKLSENQQQVYLYYRKHFRLFSVLAIASFALMVGAFVPSFFVSSEQGLFWALLLLALVPFVAAIIFSRNALNYRRMMSELERGTRK